MIKNMRQQKGQVLLITVMLIAVLLTIVLSVSFQSRTQTQLSKLEEESQRALAAAEAGIDAALKEPVGATIAISSLEGLDAFSGSATVSETVGQTFVSPLVAKDQQYTFYLSTYSGGSFSAPYSGTVRVYYGTQGGCNDVSLEITVVSGNSPNYDIKRYIADTSGKLGSSQENVGQSSGGNLEGVSFSCSTSAISSPANAKLMFVRTLFSPTRLGFQGSTTLRSQGKTITSEAKTPTGVTKKVQLFQSHPQIPADFFVTSF